MNVGSPRIAVISTVAPPGPTGQARVLGHLLGPRHSSNCLLLTDQPSFPPELAGTGELVNYRVLRRMPVSLQGWGFLTRRMPDLTRETELVFTALKRAAEI